MILTLQWLVNLIVQVITFVIIVKVLLSYFLPPYHTVRLTIDKFVEPPLKFIRRHVSPLGMFDFSPLILLILVQLAGKIIVSLLALLTP